ncbi:hypothetical protein DFJ74DRAFT_685922 [Hyaloraphidium curvatum]|nr:hypothetical protein DFJ74DRAFT_685922 [Hyaloraphidium curvatum]
MSDSDGPAGEPRRRMDERDLFGDSDSELSSVYDSSEDEAKARKAQAADGEFSGTPKLKLRIKGPAGDPKERRKKDKAADGDDAEKKKRKKKKKKDRERNKEAEGEEGDDVVKQVERDFKEALEVLKPRRKKKRDDEDTKWDDIAVRTKDEMLNAAEMDFEFRKNGQPSVAKLMMLQPVVEKLSRSDSREIFLDNDILKAIGAWLAPSEHDGSLPPLDVQRAMVGVLEKYDVDDNLMDRLRECTVGRVVMYLTKDEDVMPDIKARCQRLVDNWSKFIRDKHRKREKAAAPSPMRRPAQKDYDGMDDGDGEYRYARIPRPMNYDIVKRPESQYKESDARAAKAAAGGGKGEDSRFKRISSVLQSSRGSGSRPAPKVLK